MADLTGFALFFPALIAAGYLIALLILIGITLKH